jgi:G patch domain-containing protein 1
MHSLQAIISPQQQQRRRAPPLLAIGQRPAPLSADERGALLGEAPLAGAAPATAGAALSGWATGAAEGQRAAAAAIAEGRQQEALRRQLLQVSQADRQRLQQLLSRNFVAAESSEMLQPDGGAAAAGLRPGAPPPPPRAPAAAAAPGRVVTERDLARPAEGGDLALRPGGGLGPGDAARAAAARRPVRRSEEWRPLPLLCKRFNVPDPYHGRPAELQVGAKAV